MFRKLVPFLLLAAFLAACAAQGGMMKSRGPMSTTLGGRGASPAPAAPAAPDSGGTAPANAGASSPSVK
jgi:hypothetical protein